jgi:uncharacterized membrane protein YeiH
VQATFLLPIHFDLAATFLMAMTGVWAASRRGYDAVGAFTLAFVSGVGGGLLRDSIFLAKTPAVMQDSRYLMAVLAAVLVAGALQRVALRFERLMAYVDAVAIGVYAVVGADKALVAGIAPLGAVVIGMVNATGGGLIRDILVREEPLMFKPGQLYVFAALGGVIVFVVLLTSHRYASQEGAAIAILVTVLLRLLAIRLNWTTTPVTSWEAHFKDYARGPRRNLSRDPDERKDSPHQIRED